ncbi:MAG: SDR family oxidoreductase [Planctomycetota bacterium]
MDPTHVQHRHHCSKRVAIVTGGSGIEACRGARAARGRCERRAGGSLGGAPRGGERHFEPGRSASARTHSPPPSTEAPEQARAAIDALERDLGPTDYLVNGAGRAASAPFVKTDRQLLATLLDANFTSTWNAMQAVLPGMLQRGEGRIVNIASLAGKIGFRYVAAYCAAKHAVIGLTRAVALEVATRKITVNAVSGLRGLSMLEQSLDRIVAATGRARDAARTLLARETPQQRIFTPAEVAHVVLMLLDDDARGINGQAIPDL